MSNLVILGAQWGDEGKGKLVDLLASRFDYIIRYQGGHNAGHTIMLGDRKFVLRLVPSGILHPGKTAVIGNGLVIDPIALLEEVGQLASAGVDVKRQLRISSRAHVLLPSHRLVEKISEEGKNSLGTTLRGIGPCYEDKAGRRGLRIADLLDAGYFPGALRALTRDHQIRARAFGTEETLDVDDIAARYAVAAEEIRPMVCDTVTLLSTAMKEGKNLLFEGAQGTGLDIDHGTYPYLTSSSSCAGGACTGAGVPPTRIDAVLAISKAYTTRVGGGPFPTEALDGQGDLIRNRGKEFGSVTGRPRRCGWFDAPLVRYSSALNGFETMVVTKLDVLDALDEIRVCVGYRIDGKGIDEMPATVRDLARVEPVYQVLPGWRSSTEGIAEWDELPPAARRYLEFLEETTGVEAGCISTGPERTQTIQRKGSKFARIAG